MGKTIHFEPKLGSHINETIREMILICAKECGPDDKLVADFNEVPLIVTLEKSLEEVKNEWEQAQKKKREEYEKSEEHLKHVINSIEETKKVLEKLKNSLEIFKSLDLTDKEKVVLWAIDFAEITDYSFIDRSFLIPWEYIRLNLEEAGYFSIKEKMEVDKNNKEEIINWIIANFMSGLEKKLIYPGLRNFYNKYILEKGL